MNKIVQRANDFYGIQGEYEIREDGVKTYNGMVILATDWNVYPYGSLIETSLGTGIVLDHHTTDSQTIDLATDWGKGGKK